MHLNWNNIFRLLYGKWIINFGSIYLGVLLFAYTTKMYVTVTCLLCNNIYSCTTIVNDSICDYNISNGSWNVNVIDTFRIRLIALWNVKIIYAISGCMVGFNRKATQQWTVILVSVDSEILVMYIQRMSPAWETTSWE